MREHDSAALSTLENIQIPAYDTLSEVSSMGLCRTWCNAESLLSVCARVCVFPGDAHVAELPIHNRMTHGVKTAVCVCVHVRVRAHTRTLTTVQNVILPLADYVSKPVSSI